MKENEAIEKLLETFFMPRAAEDASDMVHAELHPITDDKTIRWTLKGKRRSYTHELTCATLEAFKGNAKELVDFLDSEISTSVHRYMNGK